MSPFKPPYHDDVDLVIPSQNDVTRGGYPMAITGIQLSEYVIIPIFMTVA